VRSSGGHELRKKNPLTGGRGGRVKVTQQKRNHVPKEQVRLSKGDPGRKKKKGDSLKGRTAGGGEALGMSNCKGGGIN